MTSATSKRPTKTKLGAIAKAVRSELEFRSQSQVFETAVLVGYLAASADGEVQASERQAIIDAVDILSEGTVIELEVDTILAGAPAEGGEAQAKALGEQLAKLGHADTGLLFGAFVAQASAGIDKGERAVLRAVGRAAGIKDRRIRTILKVVGDETADAE